MIKHITYIYPTLQDLFDLKKLNIQVNYYFVNDVLRVLTIYLENIN